MLALTLPVQGASQEDTIHWQQLLTESAQALAQTQQWLQLATALAAPDPAAQAWQLNLTVDSSCYFLTEGAAAGLEQLQVLAGEVADQQQQLRASPLGLGPQVPKLLRWAGELLPLLPLSVEELEQMVWAVWQVKWEHSWEQQHAVDTGSLAFLGVPILVKWKLVHLKH